MKKKDYQVEFNIKLDVTEAEICDYVIKLKHLIDGMLSVLHELLL